MFVLQDSSKALSNTNNVLSILHELSPAYSAPPTKRARLRRAANASETTPTSSSHPSKSKLDILLTQLQQRLSETDQGISVFVHVHYTVAHYASWRVVV